MDNTKLPTDETCSAQPVAPPAITSIKPVPFFTTKQIFPAKRRGIRFEMVEQEKSLDLRVQECLESLGFSLLAEWDALAFLYRYPGTLARADQMVRLLGYPRQVVGDALDRLVSLGLVECSRTSQGVGLYKLVFSEVHRLPKSCVGQVMSLAKNRTGRLLLAHKLRHGIALNLARKEPQND